MVSARGRVRARERVSAYAHEGFEPRLAVGRLADEARSARTREALVLHFGAYDMSLQSIQQRRQNAPTD